MENRRLTVTEKGKALVSEPYQAPRKARVRVPEPANAYLLQKHSLTLIGRVTNPSIQKVWSLLPFFSEKWATESRPVGADLGQGMFQFQFEKEEDLLNILEKRPYHYAKWMVIVERWNPTMAPDFPSLIPFWIKVQGLPVHLWTEPTIKEIGNDIGIYEEAEITSLSVRMRVQINGRLPLITSSVVEFPSGDEVTTTLVYEQLVKHCSYCFRLDHELRDCLKAKAEKREKLHLSEGKKTMTAPPTREEDLGSSRGRYSTGKAPSSRHRDSHRPSPYSRPNESRSRDRHQLNNKRMEPQYYRETNLRRIDDRSSQWRKSQSHNHYDKERSSHTSAFHGGHEPTHQSFPFETRHHSRDRGLPNSREEKEDSSASRKAQQESARGTPLQIPEDNLPEEAIAEAIGELHDVMKLYTSVADPTESAARKERYRLAQEQGEIEQTAAQMVRARLTNQDKGDMVMSPTRVPALLRLGPSPPPLASHPTGPVETRRKPGKPSGSRKKAPNSPNMLMGSSSKKRKVLQTKPPTCRRNFTGLKDKRDNKNRPATSRDSSGKRGSAQNSEDQPLCNMIPATRKKKKADFQNPPPLVP